MKLSELLKMDNPPEVPEIHQPERCSICGSRAKIKGLCAKHYGIEYRKRVAK